MAVGKTVAHDMQGPLQRCEVALLAVVVLLAAGLRMGRPGLSQFALDEAHISSLALELASGRSFPLTGTRSSVGIHLPPMGNYLYAIPYAMGRGALPAVLFTGLWNVVGVLVTWWVGRRYWGPAAGLAAALMLAVSPWAVAHSRKVWQPDLVPTLAVGTMATGLVGFVEGRRWALAAHLVLLSATLLTHFGGVVLLPVTLGLAVAHRRRVRPPHLAAGAIGALALAAPYGVHLVTHRAEVLETLSRASATGARVDGRASDLWWMTTTGGRIHALLGEAAHDSWLMHDVVATGLPWVVCALGVSAAAYWLARVARRDVTWRAQAGLAVAAWYVLPLAFYTWHSTPVHQHYMTVVLPAGPLLIGSLYGELVRRGATLRMAALTGLAGVATLQGIISIGLLSELGARATPGGFGSPLGQQLEAVAAAGNDREIIVLSPGDNAAHDGWAAVFGVHLWGRPHRLVDGRHAALFPTEAASVIYTEGVEPALEIYRLAGALGAVEEIPGRPGDSSLYVTVVHPGVLPALQPAGEPRLLSNGVEIIGYRVERPPAAGGSLTWRVAWRMAHDWWDDARSYHIFSHLVDAEGRRWAQADGSTLPTDGWRAGDTVVQAFTLALPPEAPAGPYWVRVGMYTYPEMESQDVLDIAGNPCGQFVLLGPLGQ